MLLLLGFVYLLVLTQSYAEKYVGFLFFKSENNELNMRLLSYVLWVKEMENNLQNLLKTVIYIENEL